MLLYRKSLNSLITKVPELLLEVINFPENVNQLTSKMTDFAALRTRKALH